MQKKVKKNRKLVIDPKPSPRLKFKACDRTLDHAGLRSSQSLVKELTSSYQNRDLEQKLKIPDYTQP